MFRSRKQMRSVNSCMWGVLLGVAAAGIASAQTPDCDIQRPVFVNGGVAEGKMTVVNKGAPCAFHFKFMGSSDPDEWKVIEAPKHGKIEAGGNSVKYLPEAAYTGADAFIVEVFGRATFAKGQPRNGKFAFQVDVRAAP